MIHKTFEQLRETQRSGRTLPLKYRKSHLALLGKFLREHSDGLRDAMTSDFMIPMGAEFEIRQVCAKIEKTISSLADWMKGRNVSTGWSLMNLFDRASISYDPIGVVLIIGAWNAPIATLIEPLIGAIAAGCCAIIKPSESSYHTANYLLRYIPQYLDPMAFAIFEGGPEETEKLITSYHWDLIFYTGGEHVGRIIYQLAAPRLIPVVLELGGKNPAIVLSDCPEKLQMIADRIVWAKTIKAGQLCVSVDYILVEESVADRFSAYLVNSLQQMIGLGRSADLDLIVNDRHWSRLESLVKGSGGKILYEGFRSREDRYFGPVLISEPNLESPLMAEEIFGPILPIVRIKDCAEAIEFVNSRPKPLILYAFTQSKKKVEAIKSKTRSGSICINDAFLSYLVDDLPFGGVGSSGMGSYHGWNSFKAFSHEKACLQRPLLLGWLDKATRFPPFTKEKVARLHSLIFSAPKILKAFTVLLAFAIAFALLIVILHLYHQKS